MNALKDACPECFKSDGDALDALDAVCVTIDRGLKNADTVELPGIGEFRTEPDQGRKKVVFAADRKLIDSINE